MTFPENVKYLLLAERAELQEKILSMQRRISEIDSKIGSVDVKAVNWSQKAILCLRQTNNPLTTNEMLDYIFYRKGVLNDKKQRRRYILQLSLTLHRLCKQGDLFSESISRNEKIYCLSEWKQKTEYEYILSNKKHKLIEEKKRFFAVMQ